MDVKPDTPQIQQFLTELLNADWIKRTERRLWPRYAFHYTDIRNAVDILNEGKLISRHRMEAANRLSVSSGSSEILAFTDDDIKDCVRLYFRPKTPTQYYAEGVKSKESLKHSRFPDAHCPVPVFLLFDLPYVLCLPQTRFSDKGLGSHRYHIYSTADELQQLDWLRIYHHGPLNISTPEGKKINACRNAEIIVPGELDLVSLKYIYCRSQAELETLAYLLPASCYDRYKLRMFSSARQNLFNRQHTFVETARLSTESVVLNFSPDTYSLGPFQLAYEFSDTSGTGVEREEIKDFMVQNRNGKYDLRIPAPGSEYAVTVMLDDALVYANSYHSTSLPF